MQLARQVACVYLCVCACVRACVCVCVLLHVLCSASICICLMRLPLMSRRYSQCHLARLALRIVGLSKQILTVEDADCQDSLSLYKSHVAILDYYIIQQYITSIISTCTRYNSEQ